jgi:hypothetical protein
MSCPELRNESNIGDTLVKSYIDIHTNERVSFEVPPGYSWHCNTKTSRWYTKKPLTDPPLLRDLGGAPKA